MWGPGLRFELPPSGSANCLCVHAIALAHPLSAPARLAKYPTTSADHWRLIWQIRRLSNHDGGASSPQADSRWCNWQRDGPCEVSSNPWRRRAKRRSKPHTKTESFVYSINSVASGRLKLLRVSSKRKPTRNGPVDSGRALRITDAQVGQASMSASSENTSTAEAWTMSVWRKLSHRSTANTISSEASAFSSRPRAPWPAPHRG